VKAGNTGKHNKGFYGIGRATYPTDSLFGHEFHFFDKKKLPRNNILSLFSIMGRYNVI
jgi:hypothetical protein